MRELGRRGVLSIEVPRLDTREVGIMRFLWKFVDMGENELQRSLNTPSPLRDDDRAYLEMVPILHRQSIHLVNDENLY